MAKPKRWTALGQVAGTFMQPPLLVAPEAALTNAGWDIELGGDAGGPVWGHATRRTATLVARGTTVADVVEQLWVAAQQWDAPHQAEGRR